MKKKRKAPALGGAEDEKNEYRKLLSLLSVTPAGKESRKLHKRLKAYGSGLGFGRRYPWFSLGLAVVALILSLLYSFGIKLIW